MASPLRIGELGDQLLRQDHRVEVLDVGHDGFDLSAEFEAREAVPLRHDVELMVHTGEEQDDPLKTWAPLLLE
ncbi:MAG: hypothetical protein ACU0CO_10175 [Shimia sp.]